MKSNLDIFTYPDKDSEKAFISISFHDPEILKELVGYLRAKSMDELKNNEYEAAEIDLSDSNKIEKAINKVFLKEDKLSFAFMLGE